MIFNLLYVNLVSTGLHSYAGVELTHAPGEAAPWRIAHLRVSMPRHAARHAHGVRTAPDRLAVAGGAGSWRGRLAG